MSEQPSPQQGVQVQVPTEMEAGVYANVVGVWHSAYEFTLDFCVTLPAVQTPKGIVTPARVVSRVKFPTTQLFMLLQAHNANMTIYEQTFGPIKAPEVRPPDTSGGGVSSS